VAVFADLHRKDRRLRQQAEQLRQTERLARELQIEQLKLTSERRYRNLAEAIPQMVWTADERGMLNYCNRRWTEFTGLDLAASRGLGWTKAVHKDDVRRCERTWKAHVRRGELCEFRCRLRSEPTGSYRWHVCRFVPEREEGGSIVAWLGTYTDFEDLLQAIRARDEFLSIASHELRTPLTALKLRLQSLERSASLDDKAQFKVKSADQQLQRIERLIDSLLDVARIATGQFDLEIERFSASTCLHEVVERFRRTTSNEQQFIVASAQDDEGSWDKLRFEQVLTNLLDNAVRYGEGRPVEVTLAVDDERVAISVTDRGLGIGRDDLERIFDRFERLGQRRVPGGLGMGLYIVRQIVDAHGGGISADSRVGSGSTFTFWLPRRPPTSNPQPTQ
jgi:PAS domain S-box-containing protein